MSTKKEALAIRGPLRYDIQTSSPQVEAGKSFSVAIQITNPYDVPVTIYNVNTTLPVELIGSTKIPDQLHFIKLLREMWSPTRVPEIVIASTPSLPSQSEGGKGGAVQEAPTVLQPGNSTVQSFTIRTRWAVFFQPASYNLYLWIDYEIDGQRNKDATRYKLNIRAPLKAMIYGSMVGSIMGFVLRTINDSSGLSMRSDWGSTISLMVRLTGNVLLAAIVVIAFARKKETQPILSIEDFWGGLFIGFLAGYTGRSLLNQLIPQNLPSESVRDFLIGYFEGPLTYMAWTSETVGRFHAVFER